MISEAGFLTDLRQVVGQDATIPALRTGLFLLGVLSGLAWARRRPFLSLGSLMLGGFLGLSYWLVQIVSPLGFETNPAVARDWAQAGVNAWAEPGGAGFVAGSEPSSSLVAGLATAGIPMKVLILVPAAACLATLSLLILLPFALLKNPTTAALAACIGLGGGLWPGTSPYSAILLRPSALPITATAFGMLALAAHRRGWHGRSRRVRFGIGAGLIVASALDRSLWGGPEPSTTAAMLLCGAAILLTTPLRLALRTIASSPASARHAEALVVICAFGGSGLLWWDPSKSVPGFVEARNENAAFLRPMEWIRGNVPASSVVLASPVYSTPIAAMAGRRVLLPPPGNPQSQDVLPQPFRRARLAESTRGGRPIARLAEDFSVTHLFLGPGEPSPPTTHDAPPGDEPYMSLILVYEDVKDFRVFRLVKK